MPVPVKATAANEIDPVAGAHFFAWSKSRRPGRWSFDLYLQRGRHALRVNPPGTQALAGGTDGTRIA